MNTAIIVGAGSGSRMGLTKSKLLLEIDGITVLERSVSAFCHHNMIQNVIVVCRACDLNSFKELLKEYPGVRFVIGGESRQESVGNALNVVPDETELLFIHDGARPLVTEKVITNTGEAAFQTGAAATGVPVKDTIKVIDNNGFILETPDRSALFSIQTPQVFDYRVYKRAVANAGTNTYTDDCQLVEKLSHPVLTVPGDYGNIKITTPEDISVAEQILKDRGEKV